MSDEIKEVSLVEPSKTKTTQEAYKPKETSSAQNVSPVKESNTTQHKAPVDNVAIQRDDNDDNDGKANSPAFKSMLNEFSQLPKPGEEFSPPGLKPSAHSFNQAPEAPIGPTREAAEQKKALKQDQTNEETNSAESMYDNTKDLVNKANSDIGYVNNYGKDMPGLKKVAESIGEEDLSKASKFSGNFSTVVGMPGYIGGLEESLQTGDTVGVFKNTLNLANGGVKSGEMLNELTGGDPSKLTKASPFLGTASSIAGGVEHATDLRQSIQEGDGAGVAENVLYLGNDAVGALQGVDNSLEALKSAKGLPDDVGKLITGAKGLPDDVGKLATGAKGLPDDAGKLATASLGDGSKISTGLLGDIAKGAGKAVPLIDIAVVGVTEFSEHSQKAEEEAAKKGEEISEDKKNAIGLGGAIGGIIGDQGGALASAGIGALIGGPAGAVLGVIVGTVIGHLAAEEFSNMGADIARDMVGD